MPKVGGGALAPGVAGGTPLSRPAQKHRHASQIVRDRSNFCRWL
jgi:hypothetical protein